MMLTIKKQQRARALPPLLILALLAGGFPGAQAAQPRPVRPESVRLRAQLEKTHPATHFTEILRTPIKGVYEVWMDDNVAYVHANNPRYFFFGHLFDTRTLRDLTAPRLAEHHQAEPDRRGTPVAFDQLPFGDAITTVRGKGERQLAVFSDPECPFCRQIEAELALLDNVTIHTFIVPFKGAVRPISIWCAADRVAVWRDYMLHGNESGLHSGEACAHPIERNFSLARALGLSGTPTLIWADGSRTEGFVDRLFIETRLKETQP
jgi:thiol:disulfide interchange protein DsbC